MSRENGGDGDIGGHDNDDASSPPPSSSLLAAMDHWSRGQQCTKHWARLLI